ncbi:metalloregulator ArsR/SmtB family transcription factor [Pseudoalteromonas sp. OOF1S-7]|uniref:ArsR/SmtB family transcription factor n=1 Tax=Pseudoalteromonas sp. OOF1S-7 TaxID=2917757 RepID=UPI001EF531E8|nr:metalloregulator ArsR/SmtB family transcription factor [Pseudoalteromonas sp. OOF1S-7]MCG7537600.1 metalloregulator ArsR/SmtB family transcription factor [Pseudoalteromonas sp. OOF1S-7]
MDLHAMADSAAQAEALLKMLANRNRLMILCSLQSTELSVGELNAQVPLAQSALSQHLAAMRKAGLVASRREGATVYYRIADDKVLVILQQLYQLFCADKEGS